MKESTFLFIKMHLRLAGRPAMLINEQQDILKRLQKFQNEGVYAKDGGCLQLGEMLELKDLHQMDVLQGC